MPGISVDVVSIGPATTDEEHIAVMSVSHEKIAAVDVDSDGKDFDSTT